MITKYTSYLVLSFKYRGLTFLTEKTSGSHLTTVINSKHRVRNGIRAHLNQGTPFY